MMAEHMTRLEPSCAFTYIMVCLSHFSLDIVHFSVHCGFLYCNTCFFGVIQLASKKAENKQKTLMEKLQEIDVNYGEICAEAENEAKSHKKQHGGGKGGGKGSGRKHKRKGTISSPINLTSDPDLKLCHLVS